MSLTLNSLPFKIKIEFKLPQMVDTEQSGLMLKLTLHLVAAGLATVPLPIANILVISSALSNPTERLLVFTPQLENGNK